MGWLFRGKEVRDYVPGHSPAIAKARMLKRSWKVLVTGRPSLAGMRNQAGQQRGKRLAQSKERMNEGPP